MLLCIATRRSHLDGAFAKLGEFVSTKRYAPISRSLQDTNSSKNRCMQVWMLCIARRGSHLDGAFACYKVPYKHLFLEVCIRQV